MKVLVKDVAKIAGVSEAVFRKKYPRARYCFDAVCLSDLPPDIQERYHAANPPSSAVVADGADVPAPPLAAPVVAMQPISPLYVEIAEAYSKVPNHAKAKIDKYDAILKACEGITGKRALDEFVSVWNEEHPDKKTSYQSIMKIRREVDRQGASALVGGYGKRRGITCVSDETFHYFKNLWMNDRRLTNYDCWQKTYGWALERGYNMDNFPKAGAFMRRLENEVPENARYLARYGKDAYNRKYGSTVRRDYSKVLSGECWVADHTRLDVMVIDPVSGKAARPELTVWRDFKSGYWLAYDLHIEPSSSTHIFKAFRTAARQWGVPRYIYIDNGKDFTSKDFSGGKHRQVVVAIEPERLSMCAKLGITVLHAKPYHGQSKPIERDFRILEEKFCKDFSGYTGNTTVNKPESLKKALAAMNLTPFDEFHALFVDFVDTFNRRIISSGYREGKSPLEIMTEEHPQAATAGLVRRVTDDELALLCYRTSRPMTISRNWIRDGECGVEYYADWILGFTGVKVYLRRDYDDIRKALVYNHETNEFLGEVALVETVPALAKTDYERNILKKRLAENKLTEKVVTLMQNPDMDILPSERQAALKRFVLSQEKKALASADETAIENTNAPVMLTSEARVITKKEKMATMDMPDLSVLGGVDDTVCLPEDEVFGFECHRYDGIRNANVG